IRAGGPATPTSDAARAGATTIIALTIKLDPSVGADQAQAFAFNTGVFYLININGLVSTLAVGSYRFHFENVRGCLRQF
ncbi:hypothetical protein, partial [Brucella pseudintermedia]|uniref:hypothetical protein n=2 Tax=Brucella pseudintermedia TaxID=370111 RepID=UPI0032087BC6